MSPTPAAPLWQWSACDLAGAIRAGDVSADEAVGAVIDRVQAENPRLNAIVEDLSRSAKETARQYDDHFAAHGPRPAPWRAGDHQGQCRPNRPRHHQWRVRLSRT